MGVSLLTACMFISTAQAAIQYKFSCPKQIAVTQKLSEHHAGWHSLSDQAHRHSNYYSLNGVSMYTDSPEHEASLKPDDANPDSLLWHFNSSDQTYITCEYQDTSVQLTKALPKHTRSCQLIFLKNAATFKGPIPDYILCEKDKN